MHARLYRCQYCIGCPALHDRTERHSACIALRSWNCCRERKKRVGVENKDEPCDGGFGFTSNAKPRQERKVLKFGYQILRALRLEIAEARQKRQQRIAVAYALIREQVVVRRLDSPTECTADR